MATRMLLDATHPEETRVAVVDGNRLEDFDFEVASKKQLKGNIYLARVTRVEPSLQAAFVEYGGNRHGFLPFAEIHPDYYQIPYADRQALERERALAEAEEEEDEDEDEQEEPVAEVAAPEAAAPVEEIETVGAMAAPVEGEDEAVHSVSEEAGESAGDEAAAAEPAQAPRKPKVEELGGDVEVQAERRRVRIQQRYKIQEVIKRRQVMLVQVVKEERGNKGAALTTYMSLAGRYCVLMPNTGRGGGVSRKITNVQDRKRLKSIIEALELPQGMSVILRTAGMERTKAEIKRDADYLLRLWDDIRERTLSSMAPSLIFEEASLIRRAIRDLYTRDIDEIQVEGEEGYRIAKDFMRMLMPSHARRVQPYRDAAIPLFQRYQIEQQIDSMHSPIVQLKSGGYIVIDQAEALVAIDVNSGRSTRERNIEETALKTNLEAADEVARQLRLRDLAGLIVIDFIDMDEHRHDHAVERRLKEAMKSDRARIQVGRISPFGLLELSRQRLRPSLTETTYVECPHCAGTGLIRTTDSAALHVLRGVEEEGLRHRASEVIVYTPAVIALYILNHKRDALLSIEQRYGMRVSLESDETLVNPIFRIERVKARAADEQPPAIQYRQNEPPPALAPVNEPEEEEDLIEDEEAEAETTSTARGEEDGGNGRRRKRRRRRRRGGAEGEGAEDGQQSADAAASDEDAGEEGDDEEGEAEAAPRGEGDDTDADGQRRRRRRGRRGGRRRSARRREDGEEGMAAEGGEGESDDEGDASDEDGAQPVIAEAAEVAVSVAEVVSEPVAEVTAEATGEKPAAKPRRTVRRRKTAATEEAPAAETAEPAAEAAPEAAAEAPVEAEAKPRRRRAAPRKSAKTAAAEAPAEAAPAAEAVAEPAPQPAAEVKVETKAAPAPEPEAPAAEDTAATPSHTTVIEVEGGNKDGNQPRRGGWWRRLVS
ncbi:Rne/Rng family ribonuclease [Radicibacter daui]|uniref:Rne/Rng family ribonuclease n=1 Tax=Radicibacter daui TaxID=3064829 RepID=UPI004046A017